MSKVTSSNYPSYTGSNVSIGGSNATTGVSNGTLNATYNMSDNEKAIYNYAMTTLASILPQINTFDTNTISNLQSEVNAYKEQGLSEINNSYNNSLTNLENDAVSRFGNLDNSIFKDNLGKIASERADAVSSFAQDVLSKQSDLESDELTKRYNLINLLTGVSDDIYSNALKTISTALNGSSSATDSNTEIYKALANMSNYNTTSKNTSLLANLLGLTGSSNNSSILSSLL